MKEDEDRRKEEEERRRLEEERERISKQQLTGSDEVRKGNIFILSDIGKFKSYQMAIK